MDSGSEEMQVSSTDLLLETSEIVSLIITLTFSAVIVKLSNFCDRRYFYITYIDESTETQVEDACSLHEKDGIYIGLRRKNLFDDFFYQSSKAKCPRRNA